jgi:hypothetical protein
MSPSKTIALFQKLPINEVATLILKTTSPEFFGFCQEGFPLSRWERAG